LLNLCLFGLLLFKARLLLQLIDQLLRVLAEGLPDEGQDEQTEDDGEAEEGHDGDVLGVEVVDEGREDDVGQAADDHREAEADVRDLNRVQLGDVDEEHAVLDGAAEANDKEKDQLHDHGGVPAVTRADGVVDQKYQGEGAAKTSEKEHVEHAFPPEFRYGGHAEKEGRGFRTIDDQTVDIEVEAELGEQGQGSEVEHRCKDEQDDHYEGCCSQRGIHEETGIAEILMLLLLDFALVLFLHLQQMVSTE
jgi:hypothetical protein